MPLQKWSETDGIIASVCWYSDAGGMTTFNATCREIDREIIDLMVLVEEELNVFVVDEKSGRN